MAADLAQPEIVEAPPWAEVAAKPSASKGTYDHQAGEDQQQEVAQLGVPDASNRHYEHYYSKIRRDI